MKLQKCISMITQINELIQADKVSEAQLLTRELSKLSEGLTVSLNSSGQAMSFCLDGMVFNVRHTGGSEVATENIKVT